MPDTHTTITAQEYLDAKAYRQEELVQGLIRQKELRLVSVEGPYAKDDKWYEVYLKDRLVGRVRQRTKPRKAYYSGRGRRQSGEQKWAGSLNAELQDRLPKNIRYESFALSPNGNSRTEVLARLLRSVFQATD